MSLHIKNFLENFSLIVTPISFAVSSITLYLSLKIKKRVSSAVDRNKLSLKIDEITSSIDHIRKSLEEEANYSTFSKARVLLVEIQSEYSFVGKKLQKNLNKAIKISTFPKSSFINGDLPVTLSTLLIQIKSQLRKEVEHYE